MQVNADSAITIETGCNVTDFVDGTSCTLKFSPGVSENSWGRGCRKISWSRDVVTGTYIRIRICKNKDTCASTCSSSSGGGYSEAVAKNTLSRFIVDGRDFIGPLLGVATGEYFDVNVGDAGLVPGTCCIKVACQGPKATATDPAKCCNWYTQDGSDVVSYASTGFKDLPQGFELVFGPIGEVLL
jgi:hypothetical protein